MKTTSVYFSATYTTRKVVEEIAANISDNVTTFDITNDDSTDVVNIGREELLVVGIPVYAGRVPAMAVDRIRRFKGNGTPAVAVAVYGNRHYDDALLELHDILTDGGFRVVAAGAFIAQHCIFPKVGAQRPDSKDMEIIRDFAMQAKERALAGGTESIEVPGNRPYKVPGGIAIWPTASKHCTACGKCASLCPTGAIDPKSPQGVDKEKCIKCGRCIVVCPQGVRRFWGIRYSMAAKRFNSAFIERREPEVF